ncbi:pyridoxamine 5'-phosphate oxidase family protein [Halobacillus rhizosphaerae]|uniref:pyridoxamine 5'-phosphate oxidase family protein n=1 Tax=Halobacillus rhizosphaerae TaxID=3064889 RepID=UPI00398B9766
MRKFETVKTPEELHELQGTPGKVALNKVIHRIDEHASQFIAHSPFLLLSTANKNGICDCSPRGDAPGFVQVLDPLHLLIPERMGNKRMDSLKNILENPQAGLLFIIPGLEETMRVNGTASIVKDKDLMEMMEAKGHIPDLGIIIKVEECFIHCAKAFKRSHLWNKEKWPDTSSLPSPAKIMAAHAQIKDVDEKKVQSSFDESYTKRLY